MNDFIKTLHGEKTQTPPVWLMRQAGRYLPEYRELRAQAGGFMEAVLNPAMAAEITLQPLRRFLQIDAAILFSDILVIPYALGQDVKFLTGEGPSLGPLGALNYDAQKLAPIIETVRLVRKELPPEKSLIGFCGSPWTVACYMISGRNHDDFVEAKKWAAQFPEKLDSLLDQVAEASINYLKDQIAAGANAVQLFESWAGALAHDETLFTRFIIKPNAKIVAAVKQAYPDIPVIGFPRQCGAFLKKYIDETKVDAVGLDESIDPVRANQELPENFPVQGNLSNELLLNGGEAMTTEARRIIDLFKNRPHIFNLGHGVIKETPPEHIALLLEEVKR